MRSLALAVALGNDAITAFINGAGHAEFTPGNVSLLTMAFLAVSGFILLGWVSWAGYESWTHDQLRLLDLFWLLVRMIATVSFLLYLAIP